MTYAQSAVFTISLLVEAGEEFALTALHGAGLLGVEATKRKETGTVLVTDGTNTFALCHVQETPLTLWNPGTSLKAGSGTYGCSGT